MRYAEFHPCEALRPFVRCYWELAGAAGPPETILPDGRTELVFQFGDVFLENGSPQPRAMFVGQMSKSTTVHTTGRVGCFGVRFESAGIWALFGNRQVDFANRIVRASDVVGAAVERRLLGASDTAERIAIVESMLLPRLPGRETVWCAAVSSVLSGTLSIAELRDGSGVGVRQFERLFETRVGLTPSVFARLVRFRKALTSSGSWVDVAGDCEYYDQSHLIRDFNEFTGGPPSRLRPDPLMLSTLSHSSNTTVLESV
ncbi:MAG TPA: helix-turn-helix domain-containing protein [Bryobacteraceae bacterium]|nr:helix-turn-helix domain-containing protein [Bryobacteraceae bacterium]